MRCYKCHSFKSIQQRHPELMEVGFKNKWHRCPHYTCSLAVCPVCMTPVTFMRMHGKRLSECQLMEQGRDGEAIRELEEVDEQEDEEEEDE